MRHPDTAALREFLKGYSDEPGEPRPTDQQERLPMPPMAVCRGGEKLDLPEREVSSAGLEVTEFCLLLPPECWN